MTQAVTFSVAKAITHTHENSSLFRFKQTGLSPLAPGQWKALLAAYGTLYVFLCFIRPFRIALALGATQRMERFLQRLQTKFGCQRPAAIGFAVLCSVVVWISLCALGVTLASTLAGVPFWKLSAATV
jgi:predicted PurR-regulated permease PerM